MAFLADPRLRAIPADKLERWVDRPVRHTFPRLERTVIRTATALSEPGRSLLAEERAILEPLFGANLDLEPVRIVESRWLSAPTVLGNTIRVRPGYRFLDRNVPVLVHEAVHLWQYQHFGTRYITDSVFHNVRSLVRSGRRSLAYMNYQLTEQSRLADFTAEQQATIVADGFELLRWKGVERAPLWMDVRRTSLPVYRRLIAELREVAA